MNDNISPLVGLIFVSVFFIDPYLVPSGLYIGNNADERVY